MNSIRAIIITLCMGYSMAMTETSAVVLYKEQDNTARKLGSLNLSPIKTLSAEDRVCKTQKTIEIAHAANDQEALQHIHEWLCAAQITDAQWKQCSDQLLTSVDLSSPQWRNWYSRWVKWESQPSYKEAVLSALFFPQKAFLDASNFGSWEGNQAVNYSLALSAAHYNPQAQLYHLRKFSYLYDTEADDSEDEESDEALDTKIKRMFNRDILTSQTPMANELVAIAQISGALYGISTNHAASKSTLDRLGVQSATAFSANIFYQEESMRSSLREQAGDRGVKSDYLVAVTFTQDKAEKLRLCLKAGDLGLMTKWQLTNEEKDFQDAFNYYVSLGDKGDPKGYYHAALALLDKSQILPLLPLEVEEKALIVAYLKKACVGGVSGSDDVLSSLTFDQSIYRIILSTDEKAVLRSELPTLKRILNQKRNAYNATIRNLNIISKI